MYVITILLLIASSVFAADLPAEAGLTLDDLINKLQVNQSKIIDMYAETTTTITSNIAMPGSGGMGPQKTVQKGKMWTKDSDKSKIEIVSPRRQITITNGDIMTVIDPDDGQSFTQDLSKMREKVGIPSGGSRGLAKLLDYFDLSIEQKDYQYVIAGKPKQINKFLGRMEFYIDPERWLPVKIVMYTPANKVMSTTEMEYKEIDGAWVAWKTLSIANMPIGTIKTEMVFENIQINKRILDSQFEVKR